MNEMPFLIAHGHRLWIPILIGVVLLALAVVWVFREIWARNRARAESREYAGDPKALHGVIRGETIQSHYDEKRGKLQLVCEPQASTTAYLETSEGKVVLDGPVRIATGTRTKSRRRFRDSIFCSSTFTVRDGDPVIAVGELEMKPSDAPSDYRESAATRILRGPITIAAQKPKANHTPSPLIALAILAATVGGIGYKMMAGLGDSWRHECWPDPTYTNAPGPHMELSNTDACVLANMMPDQPYVLDEYADRFTSQPIANASELAQHLDVARTLNSCDASLTIARRVPDPNVLLEEATRCTDLQSRQIALAELGRFDEAAALGPLDDHHVGTTMVLGHRWADAAAYAHHLARIARDSAEDEESRRVLAAQHWDCVGELMSWYGGDKTALQRVQALSPGDHPMCRAELAAMTTGSSHETLIARKLDERGRRILDGDLLMDEFRTLAVERTLEGIPSNMTPSAVYPLGHKSESFSITWPTLAWATALAPAIPAPPPSEDAASITYYQFEIGRIYPAVLDGDLDAAHAHVEVARKASQTFPDLAEDLMAADAVIDLRTMKTDTKYRYREIIPLAALNLRAGVKNSDDFHRTSRDALDAATHGKIQPLLDEMTGRYDRFDMFDVMAILPRIPADQRAPIVQAAKWTGAEHYSISYNYPWSTMQDIADRRAFFTLGGDKDEAAKWMALYERFRTQLVTPQMLIALSEFDNN
ncbi:MAG: hypothetical protein QM831_24255 [Kofleriaceae bacterium]